MVLVAKIKYLGIEISKGQIWLQSHIFEKIINFPNELEDRKHIQCFCGLANYARQFVKDLSKYLGMIQKKTSAKTLWY